MLPSIADIKEKISKSAISQRKICSDLQLDVTWLNKLVKKKPEDVNPSYKKIKMILDYLERKVSTKTTKKAGWISLFIDHPQNAEPKSKTKFESGKNSLCVSPVVCRH